MRWCWNEVVRAGVNLMAVRYHLRSFHGRLGKPAAAHERKMHAISIRIAKMHPASIPLPTKHLCARSVLGAGFDTCTAWQRATWFCQQLCRSPTVRVQVGA